MRRWIPMVVAMLALLGGCASIHQVEGPGSGPVDAQVLIEDLERGDWVHVTRRDGSIVSGELMAIDAHALQLDIAESYDGTPDLDIPCDDIVGVDRRRVSLARTAGFVGAGAVICCILLMSALTQGLAGCE